MAEQSESDRLIENSRPYLEKVDRLLQSLQEHTVADGELVAYAESLAQARQQVEKSLSIAKETPVDFDLHSRWNASSAKKRAVLFQFGLLAANLSTVNDTIKRTGESLERDSSGISVDGLPAVQDAIRNAEKSYVDNLSAGVNEFIGRGENANFANGKTAVAGLASIGAGFLGLENHNAVLEVSGLGGAVGTAIVDTKIKRRRQDERNEAVSDQRTRLEQQENRSKNEITR